MPDREWFTIETPNRPDARVSVWTPEGAPRAIVQIFHGMAEHIDRYDRVARDLAQKGYVASGHNHKGMALKHRTQSWAISTRRTAGARSSKTDMPSANG